MCGAKYPPAPTPPLRPLENAKFVSPSLCFSNATVEDAFVHLRLDQMGRDHRGRAADAAGGMYPHDRLAGRAERVGKVQLGHHDTFEDVGRGPDDDGFHVSPRHFGIVEGADRGLADESGHRHVVAAFRHLRHADTDNRGTVRPSVSRFQDTDQVLL